ncbi:MAG: phage holin family protein [Pseudomonadota bacterium]|nr:phage holin family protein [Pseudomonadota bacterium]
MAETGEREPGIDDAVRELGATGRATLRASRDAGKAFRILVAADIALARSAFGRSLALTGVAIAFGASAWLLLMASLIVGLTRGLGMSWTLALLLTALLSVAVTAAAAWGATRYFEHTRLKATRRQLARLGIGELADMMQDAGSASSGEEDAEAVAAATGDKPVKKGLGIDVTPP